MEKLKKLFEEAQIEFEKFDKGNKSAGVRLRKALMSFEKESKAFRKGTLK